MGTLVDGVSPLGTSHHHYESCYFDSLWSALIALVVYGFRELSSLYIKEHLVRTTQDIICELLFDDPYHVL